MGRRVALSLNRRMVCDFLRASLPIPTVTIGRTMALAEVVSARQIAALRPSWCAIFTKAFALAAATVPEMRHVYVAWPWPHFYQHPDNVASIVLERPYRGEPGLFQAQAKRPEARSLVELDAIIRHHKDAPIESIRCNRRALLVGRLPGP